MALSTLNVRTIGGATFKCSEWTAGHLANTMGRLKAAHPRAELVVIQGCYSTGVKASAGTHDLDAVLDVEINGLDWWEAQRFLRSCGWAAWYRYTGIWSPVAARHIHMASIPPGLSGHPTAPQVGAAYKKLGLKVGLYIDGGLTSTGHTTASSQIVDYFNHAQGLAGEHRPGCDTSWFPPSISQTIYQPGATVAAKTSATPVTGVTKARALLIAEGIKAGPIRRLKIRAALAALPKW
jgi:hypothetical protein